MCHLLSRWFFVSSSVVFTSAAFAQVDDVVKLRSSLNVMTDDNFLRSPASTAVSERVTSQTIGVNVALPYSLQRFELDASLTGNQHQTYTNFDYVAQNYNAAWRWGLTPRLHGSLTSARTESLNAPVDSQNPSLRNKNTTQNTAFSAAYDLGGPWQATAGMSSSSTINERPLIGQTDNRSSGVNMGLRYAQASGNSLAYSLQRASGSTGNDYTNTSHELMATWVPSGNTSVNVRMAFLDQHFGLVPQYDFNGIAGAISLNWRATGKVSVSAGWQRDLGSYPTAGTTHTQTDSLTLGPAWQIGTRTAFRLQYRYAVRDDKGNPTGAPTSRQDRLQDTSLTYSWQPRPLATLSVRVGEYTRSTTLANADFVARQLALEAQFLF